METNRTGSDKTARHPGSPMAPAAPRSTADKRPASKTRKPSERTPSVKQLEQAVSAIPMTARCREALERFFNDDRLFAIPVVDSDNTPYALIERHAFIEFFSLPYTAALFGKKSIAELKGFDTAVNTHPVMVDVSTSIDNVASIVSDAGLPHVANSFIVTEKGKYRGLANSIGLLNHITERKQTELYFLAYYDQLTKVANRMLLNDRIQMACREARRNKKMVGMFFVDLDRFKHINDTMGHAFGDMLLVEVAERLESCVRCNDTVARLGGDEFAVLLQSLNDHADAEISARRIIESFQQPFNILQREIYVTASLGIAFHTQDDADSDHLLKRADIAMYAAKQGGRNGYRKYSPDQSAHSMEQLALEADLRLAISRNELSLHHQPQVNPRTGHVVGVEVLARWLHPERGFVPPSIFITLAEESGLIIDIGNWVLREACKQQVRWMSDDATPLRMAVNISSVQFMRPEFVTDVGQIISETGVDPAYIELELTEGFAAHQANQVLNTLRDLKQLGVKLAIANFGTGYSNLSYLQHFPVDRLKINPSLVRGIESIPENRSIIQALVSFAKCLSMETVAEGVETRDEFELTDACQCDEIQGYFYAKPMAPGDFELWLRARKAI